MRILSIIIINKLLKTFLISGQRYSKIDINTAAILIQLLAGPIYELERYKPNLNPRLLVIYVVHWSLLRILASNVFFFFFFFLTMDILVYMCNDLKDD